MGFVDNNQNVENPQTCSERLLHSNKTLQNAAEADRKAELNEE